MTPMTVLTPEEMECARRHILKMEKSARTWNRLRWIVLLVAIALGIEGYMDCRLGWSDLENAHDNVIKAMKDRTPIEGLTLTQWYISEVRRTVLLLAIADRNNILAGMECAIGAVLCFSGFVLGVRLYGIWNQAPWLVIQAKMLRWQAEQCSGPLTLQSRPTGQPAN